MPLPGMPGSVITTVKCLNCGAQTPLGARCMLCGAPLAVKAGAGYGFPVEEQVGDITRRALETVSDRDILDAYDHE